MKTETKLRALIVDDEYPAREELRYLLRSFEEVEVVGEAADAVEALQLIKSINYDVCFIDIRMPGRSGLDLVKEISRGPTHPAVVFVTAYPDHAVEAFDLDAADYLVKPFDEARLTRALERILERGTQESHPAVAVASSDQDFDKIAVPGHDRTVLLDVKEVVYAVAANGYSHLITASGRHLVSQSLLELERRLGKRGFFRAHRAYLINLSKAKEIVPDFAGALQVVMENDDRVPVSRRQARALKSFLGL